MTFKVISAQKRVKLPKTQKPELVVSQPVSLSVAC